MKAAGLRSGCHVEPLNYVLKTSVTSSIIQFAYKSHKEFICSKRFFRQEHLSLKVKSYVKVVTVEHIQV